MFCPRWLPSLYHSLPSFHMSLEADGFRSRCFVTLVQSFLSCFQANSNGGSRILAKKNSPVSVVRFFLCPYLATLVRIPDLQLCLEVFSAPFPGQLRWRLEYSSSFHPQHESLHAPFDPSRSYASLFSRHFLSFLLYHLSSARSLFF
jgi:hypothetical protein